MTKRGPTDTDHQPAPPAEGDVEVVNAAGERKPASLPRRVLAGARDLVSVTDDLPTWKPGELADDQTAAAGNGDVAVPNDQPPQATMVAFRRQHTENVQRVADQALRFDGQMVTMDKHARDRVFDIGHLTALVALRNQAAALLASDGWANVTPALIDDFAAEVDGWKADRGIGS